MTKRTRAIIATTQLIMIIVVFYASRKFQSAVDSDVKQTVSQDVPPPDQSMPQVLAALDDVTIYGGTNASDFKLVLSLPYKTKPSENEHWLKSLRRSNRFHSERQTARTNQEYDYDMYLMISAYEGQYWSDELVVSYDYLVDTGELGHGHEWCYVPNDFKAWMKHKWENRLVRKPEPPATTQFR